MEHPEQHPANNSAQVATPVRRPGRPKGLPKPPGSGRKKGTPNKVGQEARELAEAYTPKAFETLGRLLDNPDPRIAAIAAQQILDRRFGRPVTPTEISGRNGEPLVEPPPKSDFELARLVAFMLTRAAKSASPKTD